MASKQFDASKDLDALMDINLTRQFFGNKSKMTIHRWAQNPALGFPQPMRIAGQNYWQRGDLIAFRDRQREKADRARAPVAQSDGPPAQTADGAGLHDGAVPERLLGQRRGNDAGGFRAVRSDAGTTSNTGGQRPEGGGRADASLVERPTSRGRSSSATGTTVAPGLNRVP